jgi:hypothetical protein
MVAAMKLYVCWGTFPLPGRSHPCRAAHEALVAAGHDPEVKRVYGWGRLPKLFNPLRGEVRKLTGSDWVPVLVDDAGAVVAGTKQIVKWAKSNPAGES